jgi:hypothetical protein
MAITLWRRSPARRFLTPMPDASQFRWATQYAGIVGLQRFMVLFFSWPADSLLLTNRSRPAEKLRLLHRWAMRLPMHASAYPKHSLLERALSLRFGEEFWHRS